MSDNHRNPIYTSGYCSHNSNSCYEYRAITSSLLYLPVRQTGGLQDYYLPRLLSESALSFSVSSTITRNSFYIVPQTFVLQFSLLRRKKIYQSSHIPSSPPLLLRKIEDHQITREGRNCKAYYILFPILSFIKPFSTALYFKYKYFAAHRYHQKFRNYRSVASISNLQKFLFRKKLIIFNTCP